MMNKLLEVKNLSVNYGVIEALKDVSVTVEEGKIVAILGANGGGKTTLLKTISGLIIPTEGEVKFMGTSIVGSLVEKITKARII